MPRGSAVSIGMARRPILTGPFHVNHVLFLFLSIIICANSGTNPASGCATNNYALTTADFGTDRCAYAATNCASQYLRLVDDNTAGALTGTVASGVITADPADCTGMEYVGAVYVFNNGDAVDDVDGTSDPVTSAKVTNDGNYAYSV